MRRPSIKWLWLPAAGAIGACGNSATPSANPAQVPAPYVVVAPREPREQLPDEQVMQVLNRLAYGPRPADAEKVRAMGVDKWIALQLAPERVPDSAGDSVVATYRALSTPTSDIVAAFQEAQKARRQAQMKAGGQDSLMGRGGRGADPQLREIQQRVQQPINELISSKMARAVVSERQLNEIMVDFWENHFSVYVGKGQTRNYLLEYDRDIIRPRAMGKFRDLLGAVAHSPAMLFYLDNWESQADSNHATLTANGRGIASAAQRARGGLGRGQAIMNLPPAQRQQALQQAAVRRGLNENYARELMELHTLGVDGGYTQHDVIEVARCLTGWSIAVQQGGGFIFRPQFHDADEKVVLGHRIPAGRGTQDAEEVLDILAHHPSTAHFIANKLVVRFVSDTAPVALVDRATQTFLRTDGDIREVVRTIVTSPEFFSRAAYRAKVKTPFEVVASALRAVNAQPDPTPRTAGIVAQLGEQTWGRQTPDGWPDRGDAWMNTGAILNRINFGLQLAGGRVPGATLANWPLTATLQTASREQQVDGVVNAILGGQVSHVTRTVLLSGENPMLKKAQKDTLGANASGNMTSNAMVPPAGPGGRGRGGAGGPPLPPPGGGRGRGAVPPPGLNRPVNLTGLPQIVGLALGAPEFQRR